MAIRALNSVIVANYNCAATASWQSGACLMLNASGLVEKADRGNGIFDSLVESSVMFESIHSSKSAFLIVYVLYLLDELPSGYV